MNKILGIDLGTTNTCAAYVSNKIPRVVATEGGFNTLPSVITLHQSGTVLIGQAAKEQMVLNPERTLHGIKRLLGRKYNSRVVQELRKHVSYKIVSGPNGEAAVNVGGKIYTAVELQTKILQQVKRYAEISLGENIPEVVIAVPAYYNDHQRSLVKQAGKDAGWLVRRLVNEPTAAALAYGFNRGFDQKILIYDLGGGTFDVSVLEVTGNVFQVVATGGDTFLGGVDFDSRIVDWMIDRFKKQHKIDLMQENSALQQLRTAAERAKIELSILANTQIRIVNILERRGKTMDLELVLDRETLNQITDDLVKRTIAVIDRVLQERSIAQNQIDEIILVGGQTRMPLVVDAISTHFGKTPRKGVHPDECVALGAALLGDSLAKIDAVTLLDAISVPIGIAREQNLEVVIDKHTSLPHKKQIQVQSAPNSPTLEVDFYQGEAGPLRAAEYLGTMVYHISGEPSSEPVTIHLNLGLDIEGMLSIEATDPRSNQSQNLKLSTLQQREPEPAIVESINTPPTAEEENAKSGLRSILGSLLGGKK